MTSSERPSPEPSLKKEAPPAVLGGGDNSGNALEASNALNYRAWGIPPVLSTGIPGKALRAFPEFFRNFFRKVPAVLGVWPMMVASAVKTTTIIMLTVLCGRVLSERAPPVVAYIREQCRCTLVCVCNIKCLCRQIVLKIKKWVQ